MIVIITKRDSPFLMLLKSVIEDKDSRLRPEVCSLICYHVHQAGR